MIAGSKGEGLQLKRLLQAVYHPRNYYLLHLDIEALDSERLELAKYVKSVYVMRNVMVIGKPDLVTYKGPTMIACTLHAVAVLLKKANDWDWFINLSASDYPLMAQDDMLHIFSYLPRDLNFLEHSSTIGWKENQIARPIIIDPGLYHMKKSSRGSNDIIWKFVKEQGQQGQWKIESKFCITDKFLTLDNNYNEKNLWMIYGMWKVDDFFK